MGPSTAAVARSARLAARAGSVALVGGIAVAASAAAPAGAAGCTAVMGEAKASPAQLAGWFTSTGRQPRLQVGILELATMFVEEGAREGVRGDIAFAQSIVETGYFGFSPSVPPDTNNYSGIGATGGGVKGARFPDARTGVRAQVQHLRAYADPSLRSAADLHAPLVDPRFGYLVPNSRTVPCWEQFGNGVWAADPSGYGLKVLTVSQRIAAFPAPPVAAPAPAAPEPAAVLPVVVEAPAAALGAAGDAALVAAGDAAAAGLPSLASGGLHLAEPAAATVTEIVTRPATAERTGGGAAAAAATSFTGLALLSICATLWWHGRRFSRV